MNSPSQLASMDFTSRKEFIDSFANEIIVNLHRKQLVEKKDKEGLLKEIRKNEYEIKKIEERTKTEEPEANEETKLIQRRFIPQTTSTIKEERMKIPQVKQEEIMPPEIIPQQKKTSVPEIKQFAPPEIIPLTPTSITPIVKPVTRSISSVTPNLPSGQKTSIGYEPTTKYFTPSIMYTSQEILVSKPQQIMPPEIITGREENKQAEEIEVPKPSRIGKEIAQPIQKAEIKTPEISKDTVPSPKKQETPMQTISLESMKLPIKPLTIEDKISFMLSKGITAVECVNGNLRIKQNGEFKNIPAKLTNNEINEIIKRFSELTKIPIVDNVFKARIKDFKISAIMSENLGPRFLIQKAD